MNSLILGATSRMLLVLLLLFSVFLLLRGHDLPGGGFVGGLVGAGAWALYGIAHGPEKARHALRVDPRALIGFGLLMAVLSGLVPLAVGAVFLEGQWVQIGKFKLGTPAIFDLGVYFIVMGATLTFILAQEES